MTYEKTERAENILFDTLGAEELLLNIVKALDIDTKADIYEYIARCHDIDIN